MEDSQLEKFISHLNYNYIGDPRWVNYINNLYPVPNNNQIIYLKKKFYKREIDSNFDINFEPNQENENKNNNNDNNNNNDKNNYDNFTFIILIFQIEGILKIVFYLFFLLFPFGINKICFSISFLALLRQLKTPKFSKIYGRNLFKNEYFHNILFLIPCLFLKEILLFFYLPYFFHFIIGIIEFLNYNNINFLGENVLSYIRKNKKKILSFKILCEIILFLIAFIGSLFQIYSIYFTIFFANFLRMKFISCSLMQEILFQYNEKILNSMKDTSPNFNLIYQKFILILKKFVS